MNSISPAYLALLETGELAARAAAACEHLSNCDLCPWNCKKDRRSGKMGVCRTGEQAQIYSWGAHMGEEAPLSGWRGSGTIFFAGCNMRCQYCQNHEVSQGPGGRQVGAQGLAEVMLELQEAGCHNINLVSPSHVVPQILSALLLAAREGLNLPLVYNTGGYDSLHTLRLLEGVIDIYLPDMKYASAQIGLHYSKVRNYPTINQPAVVEMHRQVGELVTDENGLARRGLLVRHLVLPNGLAGTQPIVNFLAEKVSGSTVLNLMDQYQPYFNAHRFPRINRSITPSEYAAAVQFADQAGLVRLN